MLIIVILDEEYVQDPTEMELMKSMGLPTQFHDGEKKKMKRRKKQKKGFYYYLLLLFILTCWLGALKLKNINADC